MDDLVRALDHPALEPYCAELLGGLQDATKYESQHTVANQGLQELTVRRAKLGQREEGVYGERRS